MITGDIVIFSFPYTDLTSSKARPAVIVNVIEDNYNDVILCFISSVIRSQLTQHSILLKPDTTNNLKATSLVKVSRIATVENSKIKAVIGRLNKDQIEEFKNKFKSLVD